MSARLGDLSFFFPPLATFLAVDDAFSATFLEVVLALDADLVTDSLAFDAAFFEEALVTVAICLAFLVAATLRFLVAADFSATAFLAVLAAFFALVDAFDAAFLPAALALAGAFLTLLPAAAVAFFASAWLRPAP